MSEAAETPTAGDRIRGRVLAAIRNEPWLIIPEKLEMIDQIVVDRLLHGKLDADASIVVVEPKAQEDEGPIFSVVDAGAGKSIAVLPIHGVISKRLGLFERISGGTSSDAIAEAARAIAKDNAIAGVVLDVDSPGGQVAGTEAAAAALRELGKAKPMYAVANDLMASAAYWLGSTAKRIFAPSTAGLGSIGVALMHMDRSKQYEKNGVRPTLITVGANKGVGADHVPLDDAAIAVLKERLESQYDSFVEAVAQNRGLSVAHVKEKIADGRVFTGKQAIQLRVADELGTLETAIAKLTGELTASASQRGIVPMSTAAEKTAGDETANAGETTNASQIVIQTTPVQKAVVEPAATVDRKAIEAAAIKAEKDRQAEIRSLVETAGLDMKLAGEFIDADCSVAATQTRIFEIMRDRNKTSGIGAAHTISGEADDDKAIEAKARKEFDAQADVYANLNVSFETFLKTWKKQQEMIKAANAA